MITQKYKSSHVLSAGSFYQAVFILVMKPHVINKRLWGSRIWFKYFFKSFRPGVAPNKLENKISEETVNENAEYILRQQGLKKSDAIIEETQESNFVIILTELLPKLYTDCQAYQLICINKCESTATFYNVTPESFGQNLSPDFTYTLSLDENKVVISAYDDGLSKSYSWLINTVVPQFVKWGNELQNDNVKQRTCIESLGLVSKCRYYQKYNELKIKYGKEMVKIWPECTDPSKFVYEDVAIATYLLLLWEDEYGRESKKQTFVDLGCGNGLLVYILWQEGHSGLGIDIRKRQIWDMYPSGIRLEEKLITPSEISLHADADWIIGNHSDELTPWIPVIASKSSYKCNFFVLPCCAYNFDGTKYQRKNSNKSQYTEYLEYIKQLCEECGFQTFVDRLKIPSTKRICIVSKGRTYKSDEYHDYCEKVHNIITRNTNLGHEDTNSMWIQDFRPREIKERVRNCTQIDKNLIESIVITITNYLLKGCCSESDSEWSIGKVVEINDLVQLIPQDQLKQLKSECGGLQTLIKNNHHIFQVQQGKVQLRYPKTIDEVNNSSRKKKNKFTNIKIQEKPCWFYNSHPQGCPLNTNECSFLHIKR